MYDFLLFDSTGNRTVTRDASPFRYSDFAHRVPALPAQWLLLGEEWFGAVSYAGKTWICRDGTIVPAEERPKRISKLDLLLVLRELDKIGSFFAWLEQSGLKHFWDAAQVMATNHPLFADALASAIVALEITPEEAAAIIERIAH